VYNCNIVKKKIVTLNKWQIVLDEVEYALSNMSCASMAEVPSKLLFGVHQGGTIENVFKRLLLELDEERNLEDIKREPAEHILKNQWYNKKYLDQKHKKNLPCIKKETLL